MRIYLYIIYILYILTIKIASWIVFFNYYLFCTYENLAVAAEMNFMAVLYDCFMSIFYYKHLDNIYMSKIR